MFCLGCVEKEKRRVGAQQRRGRELGKKVGNEGKRMLSEEERIIQEKSGYVYVKVQVCS